MLFAHSLVCNDQSYMTSTSVVHDSEISPMISRYVCELTFIRISVIFKHQLYLSHALIFLYAIFVTWLWLSQAAEVLSSVLRREPFVASVWAMHCLFCERGWTAIWTVICLIDSAVYFLLWKEMDSKSSLLFQCPVPNSQIFCLGRRHKFLLLWAHFFFQDQELRTRRIRTNIGSGSRLINSV